MLILTRRIGETIIINDNITVTVLGVKGCQVRLGINAPKDVSVDRQEIHDKKQLEIHPSKGNSPAVDIAAYFGDHSN